MATASVTLGTDSEFFLRDKRTGGVTPAVGLLGGTKAKPLPMEGMPSGYAIQEDNVMGEFNIPPATCGEEFGSNVSAALQCVTAWVDDNLPNMEIDAGHCSRLFAGRLLSSAQAKEFGCSADFNAYEEGAAHPTVTPQALRPPDGDDGDEWRAAGAHVHIGYTSAVPPWVVARFCDLFLALPSAALDLQGQRRALYGQPGRYRPKPYGLEYRTLSNFWVWDRTLAEEIGYRAYNLGALLSDPKQVKKLSSAYTEVPWSEVHDAVATENPAKATDLLHFCGNELKLEVLQ